MLVRLFLLLVLLVAAGDALAGSLPLILAAADNAVPACVAPDTLMEFVAVRNAARQPPREIDQRFSNLAAVYQRIGQCVARPPERCVGVRWDYAFFQMLIETNYLTFMRPDGTPASLPPQDNNFAGVGATVSGKPGETFNDIATGVLAHLQHVLMYSTMHVPEPVARRTRQVQDDLQATMRRLHRPVTFADLAREWTGTDQNSYGSNMEKIAEKYAANYCRAPARGSAAMPSPARIR